MWWPSVRNLRVKGSRWKKQRWKSGWGAEYPETSSEIFVGIQGPDLERVWKWFTVNTHKKVYINPLVRRSVSEGLKADHPWTESAVQESPVGHQLPPVQAQCGDVGVRWGWCRDQYPAASPFFLASETALMQPQSFSTPFTTFRKKGQVPILWPRDAISLMRSYRTNTTVEHNWIKWGVFSTEGHCGCRFTLQARSLGPPSEWKNE